MANIIGITTVLIGIGITMYSYKVMKETKKE